MPRRDAGNVTRFWRDRRLPGLSLMAADLGTLAFARHTHDALVVAVTEAGGALAENAGVEGRAHPGTLLVTSPAEPHAARVDGGERWGYRAFYLTRPAMAALGLDALPRVRRPFIEDADLADRFLALHRALDAGDDAPLHDAFGRLFERWGGGTPIRASPDDGIVGAVAARMRVEFAEALSLDDLAHGAGLSPHRLIRAFRRTVGLTPHAYLTQVRLGAACRRLRRGAPIAEVAAAVGFYDQAALTKHFKRCYALTPRQFAAAGRRTL